MPTIEETRVLLVEKLKELFQLDQPDLDFGFYRIMHMRSKEITDFLEKDLLTQVKDALTEYTPVEKQDVQKRLNEAIKQAESLGADPETLPKVKELREKLSESIDMKQVECDVYDALYHFFSRYYSDGDFISQRVYKEGVYAIPYEGEEVKLHWANADQYYVKTCEYLRDYCFRTESNRRVHFKLVDATEGEHGNIKASEEKNRVFILAKDNFCAEENGELILRFEYRPATMNDWPKDQRSEQKSPPTQDDLITFADAHILAQKSTEAWTDELGKPYLKSDGEDAEYSLLTHHLKRYAARNTFDYFIHKDLGTFLRRELDFFIKNEIMYLDDIEKETAPRVEQYLSQLRAIRRIAKKIITFLAQLEDFQKKLWLKKKFVVETNYCITLDRVPEEFYEEIVANDAQREEWVKLFDWNADVPSASPGNRASRPVVSVPTSQQSLLDFQGEEDGEKRGWYSRGYLPHFESANLQFITLRLFDSVPKEVVQSWKDELAWNKKMDSNSPVTIALRKKIEVYEDQGKGSCFLKIPEIADMVQNVLFQYDGKKYRLINWTIMPNHLHILIDVLPGNSLSSIMQSWKSYTSHEANRILNRTGNFWMPDYFDRYIRNGEHFDDVNNYIDNNAVKGKLVDSLEKWQWCGRHVAIGDALANTDSSGRDARSPGDAGETPAFQSDSSGRDARSPGDAGETPAFQSTLPPNLVLDTKFFSEDFKQRLLDAIPNFDEQCDGLLIHSENFQALNLLQSRYKEQVKCVYIDPPYNTGGDGFIYKDSYRHSCWLTLMFDRLKMVQSYLPNSGTIFISIDDYEFHHLCDICNCIFGEDNMINNKRFIWHIPNGTNKGHVARAHEYILAYAKYYHELPPFFRKNNLPSGSEERCTNAPTKDNPTTGILFHKGLRYEGDNAEFEGSIGGKEPIRIEGKLVFKNGHLDSDVMLYSSWRNKDQIVAFLENGIAHDEKGQRVTEIFFASNGKPKYKKDLSYYSPKSVQIFNMDSTEIDIKETYNTRNPKPCAMINLLSSLVTVKSDIILDFFAGSGTTGHAVINLNREDDGHRKYILVEMGDHFDTVLKPRIEKVIYSKDWKDGKPGSADVSSASSGQSSRLSGSSSPLPYNGVSQCVKYIRLESYEDTLNNLSLSSDKTMLAAIQYADDPDVREEYVLKYFLEEESRGSDSLLNIDHFMEPTEYRLKIKKPGSDESVYQPVDLLETFNYLIGLQVDRIAKPQRFTAKFKRDIDGKLILDGKLRRTPDGGWRFRTVTGTTLDGQRVLVIWRNRPGKETSEGMEQDNQVLDAWFNMLGYDSQGSEFNIIYINGTNNIDNLNTTNELWKVRLIEDEFQTKMWE